MRTRNRIGTVRHDETPEVRAIEAHDRVTAASRLCGFLGLCMDCGADIREGEAHKVECDDAP
jgi:hypothetical protein